MTSTARTRGRGPERGAATLETTGLAVVAATLVLGLLVAASPQGRLLAGTAAYRVCQVVTAGQGGCAEPGTGATQAGPGRAPTEPCVLAQDGVERSEQLSAVVVTASDGRRVEISSLSDQTYRVSVAETRGGGVEVGVGGGVSLTAADRTVGGAATADAGGELVLTSGEVYLAGPDEIRPLLDGLLRDQVKDAVAGDSGPARWLTDRGTELLGLGPDLPEPDETWAEGGLSLNASAEATAGTASARAGVSTARVLGVRTKRDGTTTVYLTSTVSGAAGLQTLGLDLDGPSARGATLDGSAEVVSAVTFDPSGTMVAVQATATTAAGSEGLATVLFGGPGDADLGAGRSGTTVHQATLPVRDAADRAAAEQYLLAQGVGALGGWTNPAVALPATALTTSFFTAARSRGTTTRQDYATDAMTVAGFDASGKYGIELGASGSVSTDSMRVSDARYWDGTDWVDWDACRG